MEAPATAPSAAETVPTIFPVVFCARIADASSKVTANAASSLFTILSPWNMRNENIRITELLDHGDLCSGLLTCSVAERTDLQAQRTCQFCALEKLVMKSRAEFHVVL